MYLDFVFLISNYFRTLKRRVVIYEWFLPIALGIFFFLIYNNYGLPIKSEIFNNNLVKLFAVLIGFSITIITILTTGHSRNLEEIKNTNSQITLKGKSISLYQYLIINYTYSVVIEIFLIIICLVYPLLIEKIDFSSIVKNFGFCFVISLSVHVLLLTIRNLTDFCLILTKNIKIPPPNTV